MNIFKNKNNQDFQKKKKIYLNVIWNKTKLSITGPLQYVDVIIFVFD